MVTGLNAGIRQVGMLVTVCALAVAMGACSKQESAAPRDYDKESTIRTLLGMSPDSANTAIVLPSFESLEAQLSVLAKRMAPDEAALESLRAKYLDALAQELGVPDADSLATLFTAKGVDSSKAIALYLGEERVIPALSEPSASPKPVVVPETADAPASPSPTFPEDAWALADSIQMAVIVHMDNEADALASLHDLFATHPNFDAGDEEPFAIEGFDVQRLPETGHAYIVREDRLIVANDTLFLGDVLLREDDPAEVRYATPECPAPSENAIVALARLDKMTDPRLAFLGTLLEETGMTAQELFGPDPLVLNFTVEEEVFEVLGRMDLARHEGLRRTLGRPTPLRLAPVLPEDSAAVVSLRFNDEAKGLMMGIMGRLMLENEGNESGLQMIQQVLTQFTGIIDDEISLAVTGENDGSPTLVGLLAIDNRDQLNSLLAMIPGQVHETLEGVEIKTVPLMMREGFPFFYGIARNTLVVGTVLDEVRGSIQRLLGEETTGVLASFTPPVDPALPRYGAAFVKAESLDNFDIPILTPQEAGDTGLNLVLANIRDNAESMRLSVDVEETWLNIRLGFILKPTAAGDIEEE